MFFRAEDEGDVGTTGSTTEFAANDRRERWELDDGLLRLAMFKRAGAEDEGGVGESFGERCFHFCVLE
jgi:hypothetical protein